LRRNATALRSQFGPKQGANSATSALVGRGTGDRPEASAIVLFCNASSKMELRDDPSSSRLQQGNAGNDIDSFGTSWFGEKANRIAAGGAEGADDRARRDQSGTVHSREKGS